MQKVWDGELFDTDEFKVAEQAKQFVDNGGNIFVCGTYLKIRQSESSEMCPLSTMKDLYEIVKDGNRIVTF